MELLLLAFTSGWTSGINAYVTVVILGLVGSFAGVDEIPLGPQRTDVLIVAAVVAAMLLIVRIVVTVLVMGRTRKDWKAFRRWYARHPGGSGSGSGGRRSVTLS